jgi:hypothetical protein
MTPRQTLIAALLMVGCTVPAAAAPAVKAGTPASATAAAGKRSAPARKAHATATAPASGTKAGATVTPEPADATARYRSEAAKRTLDDIQIEGEIPVPQVLFITTRDQRRFMGFQYRRYLRTSRKIGEDTAVPSRIIVTGAATMPERSRSDD